MFASKVPHTVGPCCDSLPANPTVSPQKARAMTQEQLAGPVHKDLLLGQPPPLGPLHLSWATAHYAKFPLGR